MCLSSSTICVYITVVIFSVCDVDHRSGAIYRSRSVSNGGVWGMVLSVSRAMVIGHISLNFHFLLLFQQCLYILRALLLYKFSSIYIE